MEIWRLVAGLSLLAGLLAPFALVLLLGAWDMRLTGETLAAAMLWLAAAILVPLVLFRRFHNRVRGLLEASWVVETLRGEVTMPSGIPIYDLVNIYAKHHGEEPPLDLATQTDPQA